MKSKLISRISQNEAMKYVSITSLTEFSKWRDLRNIPYSVRNGKILYRIQALDNAILEDEQETFLTKQNAKETLNLQQ